MQSGLPFPVRGEFSISPEDMDRGTTAGERDADEKWAYCNHSSIIFIFPLVHPISIPYVSVGQYQNLRDLPYIPPSSDPPLLLHSLPHLPLGKNSHMPIWSGRIEAGMGGGVSKGKKERNKKSRDGWLPFLPSWWHSHPSIPDSRSVYTRRSELI